MGFKNLDDYKREAGGRDMAGNTILSNEAGATAGGAYSTTWETELRKLAPELAAGVNQNVFHGFSYATTPESRWPGFSAFSPLSGVAGYGESWGPRQPTWKHASDISGLLRAQPGGDADRQEHGRRRRADPDRLRRRGLRRAVLLGRHPRGGAGPQGRRQPRRLDRRDDQRVDARPPNATVRGKRLAPDGPNFKALVLEGDVAFSRAILLRVATAQKLLDWAKAGLPIVIVGDWSAPSVPAWPRRARTRRSSH